MRVQPCRKIRALCLTVVIALGLFAAAPAGAARQRVATTNTLVRIGPDGAQGKLSSKRKACRRDRSVTLYRQISGPPYPTSGPVSTTRTSGDGSWTIPGPLPQGLYFAVAKSRRAGQFVCRAAVSNAEPV
jgi:hypothetical protein